MSSYKRIAGNENSGTNFSDLDENLKLLQVKMKEFGKLAPSSKSSSISQIKSLCNSIESDLSRPRRTAQDKSKLEVYQSSYNQLKKNLSAILSQEVQDESRLSDDIFDTIQERKSLVLTQEQLENEGYTKRKEEIDQLHKDLRTVNEMFKDTAMMVKEQEEMLIEVDKDVTNAAGQTGKAVGELNKAEGYQRSAKKKICIIMVIALVVVGVALAIVFGVKLF